MYELAKGRPVVQKYGGTSVGSVERIRNIAKRVKGQLAEGHSKIAIVVSAMAGETNRLVDLVMQTNPDASPRNYDMAVAAGEQVSVALVAAALEAEGMSARGYLGYQLGIRTDDLHAKARIQSIDTARLFAGWERGEIPIIAGFQGVTDNMEITTLGRGGSDTSAVALAVALGAGFCEINTDVDGVYTADPRYVSKAKLCQTMDFEVALEMASLGSKVLHPRCVELGAKYNMPIVVRNTFTANDHQRTKIMRLSDRDKLEAPVVSGITVDRNIAKITVDGLPAGSRIISELFQAVAKRGVNVDIIVYDKTTDRDAMRLGFTIGKTDASVVLNAFKELEPNYPNQKLTISTDDKVAKVSAVGLGMQSHPGVASKTFETLAAEGIEILMISTSEIKISCVIGENQANLAAEALHRSFIG